MPTARTMPTPLRHLVTVFPYPVTHHPNQKIMEAMSSCPGARSFNVAVLTNSPRLNTEGFLCQGPHRVPPSTCTPCKFPGTGYSSFSLFLDLTHASPLTVAQWASLINSSRANGLYESKSSPLSAAKVGKSSWPMPADDISFRSERSNDCHLTPLFESKTLVWA